MAPSDYVLLSPPIPVEWAGFESNTARMQACGWEFAVEDNHYGFTTTVFARHRRFGVTLRAELRGDDIRSRSVVYTRSGFSGFSGPPVRFHAAQQHHETFITGSPVDWTRVDMNPSYVSARDLPSFNVKDLFRPWAPESKEILVEPDTVADLFERIKKLQSHDLEAIRERNRKRDLREQSQEQVVAQIITLAA